MNIKRIAKYVTIAAVFLIPIFPLIVTTSLMSPFMTGKAFFFRILVEVAFAGWIVLACFDTKYRPKLTSLTVVVSLFALVSLVADIFGVSPIRSLWSNFERMEGWITIIHLWALYMVLTNIFGADEDGRKLWRKWFNVSLLVAVVVSFYGLFQLFGWGLYHLDIGRMDASFGNESYLAVYMIFNIFIALYLFLAAESQISTVATKKMKGNMTSWSPFRWMYIVLVILFSFIIFETQTRGAVIGLVGGVLLALVLFAIFNKGRSKMIRWVTICLVGLVVLGGVLFWSNRDATFIQKSPLLSRFASISLTDQSSQPRLFIWPMAIKGAMERPILGWGQENFSYIFQAEYDPAMYNMEPWFDRVHNVFLDTLVNSGFVGLLTYLALYILFLLYLWKSALSMAEKCVLTGLLVGYIFNNLFIFDNLGSYFWFFALLAYINTFKQGRAIQLFGTKPLRKDIAEYVFAPLVFILLIGTVYFVNVRQIGVGRDLLTVLLSCGQKNPNITIFQSLIDRNVYMANKEVHEQLYSCATGAHWNIQVSDEIRQKFSDLAKRAIKDQIDATPDDSRSYYFAGTYLNRIGQMGEAEGLLMRAHALSPRKQIFSFALAENFIFQKDFDQALAILKQAYESATSYEKAALAYAMGLEIAGNSAEAHNIALIDEADKQTLGSIGSYMKGNEFNKAFVIFRGAISTSRDVNFLFQQAQMEYGQGMKDRAINTLREIEIINPVWKSSIEETIKGMQK